MRTSTLILSLTTATFAATTAWLTWELRQRDAAEAVVTAKTGVEAGAPGAAPSPFAERTAAHAAAGGTTSREAATLPTQPTAAPYSPAGKRDLSQDPSVMFARQFLARYDDSAQRQAQLEETRAGVRRQYGRLKEQLGLSDQKFEQLVDLIAQQNLQAQEHWARCAIDADCDPNNPSPLADDRSQELLATLGPEHIDAFNRYRDSLGERDSVAAFRGRLSDLQFLPQAQAEQLISALTQEREAFSQEVRQSGSSLRGYGTNLGMIWYSDAAGTPDAQLAEAMQYSQRLRTRAATVLTPAQLAAFIQMQEELLAQMATFLRPPPPPRKASSLKLAQG